MWQWMKDIMFLVTSMVTTMNKIIDNYAKQLIQLSLMLHKHPEMAFEEVKASRWLTEFLKHEGFEITENVGGLETAFIASYDTKKEGPHLAYIAEYDALKNIGHACGHNLIATMSVGAALALSRTKYANGVIHVIGTPAEEGGGGKIMMLDQGVFDKIDYAMMIHPSTENLIMRGGLATRGYSVSYLGKSAHSSSPEEGINALTSVLNTFYMIDQERGKMPIGTNINGIILEGGVASNVIPNQASCKFSVRAKTVKDLEDVIDRLDNIVSNIDHNNKTSSKVKKGLVYSERYPNKPMAETLKQHMKHYDIHMNYPRPNMKLGSSDIGNVSIKLPTIHSYLNIWDEEGDKPIAHDSSFTEAAKSEFALKKMLIGAKALAYTGESILKDKQLQLDIKAYHKSIDPQST